MSRRPWLIPIALLTLYAAPQKARLDQLVVYGSDFAFGVHEPEGWAGDTEIAERFHSNIVFYRGKDRPVVGGAAPFIRIRVNHKVDENTLEDLRADMEDYKREYPTVQFEDVRVDHPEYRCFAKLFFVPGRFYEYVTYINPGEGKTVVLSVSLSQPKRRATEEELDAYLDVIRSLVLLKSK